MNRLLFLFILQFFYITASAQANYNATDPERDFKEAKNFFIHQQYALAYPLLKDLKRKYPENTASSHTYLNQVIEYFILFVVWP